MGIEEGEEVQAKGIYNIFNKILQKFPKSREIYAHTDARGQKTPEHQTDQTKIEPPTAYYH
jgi:hypothetical protein